MHQGLMSTFWITRQIERTTERNRTAPAVDHPLASLDDGDTVGPIKTMLSDHVEHGTTECLMIIGVISTSFAIDRAIDDGSCRVGVVRTLRHIETTFPTVTHRNRSSPAV